MSDGGKGSDPAGGETAAVAAAMSTDSSGFTKTGAVSEDASTGGVWVGGVAAGGVAADGAGGGG